MLAALPLHALAVHSAGHALWTNPSNGIGTACSGCHGDPPVMPLANAANRAAVIDAAVAHAATGMGALNFNGSQRAQVAAYLETVFNTASISRTVSFQGSATHSLASYVRLGRPASAFTALVSATLPAKGNVSYASVAGAEAFTYTAGACRSGNDTFTYYARNGADSLRSSARTVNVTIGDPTTPPVLSGGAPATGRTGVPYSGDFDATCESGGLVTYSISGGVLPPGLALNAATGAVTGTPTTAGTYDATIRAQYSCCSALFDTRALRIEVAQGSGTGPGGMVNGTLGVAFTYTVPATGATAFAASGLPPGLSIDAASGVISGTPTTAGTYEVTITVNGASGTTTLTLVIVISSGPPTAGDASVQVAFETPTQVTLPVTGEQYTVNVVSLPSHGLVSVPAGGNVATYTPAIGYAGPDSFTYTATNAAGTSPPATVTITVLPAQTTGRTAVMTVQLNTPTTMDMAPLISGAGVTGVAIAVAPAHGVAAVNGLSVTYTPRTDFFGTDSFRYIAYGSAGPSSPATITIVVVGRPDPARDPDVVGLVEAQNRAARRFAVAQVGNLHRRMESLHRGEVIEPGEDAGERPGGSAIASPTLVASLARVVASKSLALDGGAGTDRDAAMWIAGSAGFGDLDASGRRSGARFGTDGVTLGADRRFGSRVAAGVAAGFAQDDTRVGDAGTRSKARAASLSGYGTYQAGPRTFVDALVGFGSLRFDSERHVAALGEMASARRKGRQLFGSIAGAYEHREGNLLLAPYGRLDFSIDRLDAVAESGAGAYALAFGEQEQRSGGVSLGVRAESRHETEFGFAEPRARAEYRREVGGTRAAPVRYADLGGGEYLVSPAGTSRNALLLGVGVDLLMRGGLRIGLDYLAERASGASNTQGVRLMLTQDLDAAAWAPWRFEPMLFERPVNLDFGFTHDANVNRGRESTERLGDNVFSMSANSTRTWPVASNVRVQVTGLASGEKLDRYAGLGRLALGGQAEAQYRSSGAYDATTFALTGRVLYEYYESRHRRGPRYFIGASARRALTDRIEAFGELGANLRHGESDVFNWRDYAARFNLDYALGRRGILYLSGEYRRGDVVSSGPASLVNAGIAEVFVPDDAFEGLEYFAYRFEGRTLLGTLGLNYPLGARDSIDLSWRRVQSTPRGRPQWDAGTPRYTVDQYTLMYLMRF